MNEKYSFLVCLLVFSWRIDQFEMKLRKSEPFKAYSRQKVIGTHHFRQSSGLLGTVQDHFSGLTMGYEIT